MYSVRVHGLNFQLASNLSFPIGIVLLGEIDGGEQVGLHVGFYGLGLLTGTGTGQAKAGERCAREGEVALPMPYGLSARRGATDAPKPASPEESR